MVEEATQRQPPESDLAGLGHLGHDEVFGRGRMAQRYFRVERTRHLGSADQGLEPDSAGLAFLEGSVCHQ
jgi:hypothetical protein